MVFSRVLIMLLLSMGLGSGPLSGGTPAHTREVTLLFTNDLESAFDPIPAWWRNDVELVGESPRSRP